MKKAKKKIIFIGGTGSSIIGNSAKKISDWEISLMVSLVDDGGSTGKLRSQLNILPVGDIRKALVSLSIYNKKTLDSFEYRFGKGELKGHSMGNILLAGLILEHSDLISALKTAQKIFKTRGKILTTTLEKTTLITEFKNGKKIIGEHNLDMSQDSSLGCPIKYSFKKNSTANPLTMKEILKANYIVFGPGDLGANIIAPIITKRIREAIRNSKAKLIFIGNLMTKKGETSHFLVNDCLDLTEKLLRRKFDFILLNNFSIPNKIKKIYSASGQKPMKYDLEKFLKEKRKIIESDLVSEKINIPKKHDLLKRSLITHDGEKVIKIIKKIIENDVKK